MKSINSQKKTYCFDLDGVICNNTYGEYENAIPKKEAIKKINKLFDNGNYIIIYTARFMGFAKGDIKKAESLGFNFTINQLNKWNLKYHKLLFGKPEYDIIIDDKSYNYSDKWIKEI